MNIAAALPVSTAPPPPPRLEVPEWVAVAALAAMRPPSPRGAGMRRSMEVIFDHVRQWFDRLLGSFDSANAEAVVRLFAAHKKALRSRGVGRAVSEEEMGAALDAALWRAAVTRGRGAAATMSRRREGGAAAAAAGTV